MKNLKTYGGHFDPEKRQNRIKELESEINKPNFWSDRRHSSEVMNELNSEKKILNEVQKLIDDSKDYLEMSQNADDEETVDWLNEEYEILKNKLDEIQTAVLLNGEYDKNDAVLEIHSGAGGTEACDWANMLYRMYSRWCEKKKYKIEVVDEQPGLEAGIKVLP